MLMNHSDTVAEGVPRGVKYNPSSGYPYFTGIGCVESGKNPHQRCFAGAVFPEQAVDFSAFKGKVHTVACMYVGKFFYNPSHRNSRRVWWGVFGHCLFF